MKKQKIRLTLGNKLFWLTLALCVLLCAAALTGTWAVLRSDTKDQAEKNGLRLSVQMAEQVTTARMDSWLTAGADEDYGALLSDMQLLSWQSDPVRLSLLRYREGIWTEVAAASEGTAVSAEPANTDAELSGAQREWLTTLLNGSGSTALKGSGQVTTFYPIREGDGSLVGCILCEIGLTGQLAQNNALLKTLALVLLVAVVVVMVSYMLWVNRLVTRPIRQLTDAVQAYEGGENRESLRKLELKSSQELQSLADAFRMMLVEIDLRGFEERELAVREERIEAELKLTNAINTAMQPKELPVTQPEPAFQVQGLSDKNGELHCDFYDYFLLDDGRLCMVVGAVPSEGVSAALYMVIAKTTIKNQLRVGLSLSDAIAETNRQLYEVGQGMKVNVLVGILDENGLLTYVNAGHEEPLLMRAQDRYERLTGPVCASLGQNENLSCPVRTVQLFQGDRMFVYTAGLGMIKGEDDSVFGEARLQAMLNTSRSKHLELGQLLEYMQSEGKAFAANARKCGGFSLLALDYLRRRKDLAHCVVDRDRNGAMKLSDFLKRQFSDNGLSRRMSAQLVVLADEVFALCCRQHTEGLITVECEIASAQSRMILRLKSAFAGSSPLEIRGGDAENALEFIRRNTRELLFQSGETQDVLTVVADLPEETE